MGQRTAPSINNSHPVLREKGWSLSREALRASSPGPDKRGIKGRAFWRFRKKGKLCHSRHRKPSEKGVKDRVVSAGDCKKKGRPLKEKESRRRRGN